MCELAGLTGQLPVIKPAQKHKYNTKKVNQIIGMTSPKGRTNSCIHPKICPLYSGFPLPKMKFIHMTMSLIPSSVSPCLITQSLSTHPFLFGTPFPSCSLWFPSYEYQYKFFPGFLYTCPKKSWFFVQLKINNNNNNNNSTNIDNNVPFVAGNVLPWVIVALKRTNVSSAVIRYEK
jgi:hypothetical protein